MTQQADAEERSFGHEVFDDALIEAALTGTPYADRKLENNGDVTWTIDETEESSFTYEVSDDALEAAGGATSSDWTPSPKCTKTKMAVLCCR